MDLRDVQRHFDGIAAAYYDIVDRIWYEFGYFHGKELAFLRNSLRNKPRLAIDAGCGPGRHTLVLASKSERVVAVDVSRKMLELARERVPPFLAKTVDFVLADVRLLPFKAGIADFIVNLEVIEHFPDGRAGILSSFREFRRILSGLGELVTEVPLRSHRLLSAVAPGSRKEINAYFRKQYYEDTPLPFAEAASQNEIEKLLRLAQLAPIERSYVRVIPAGVVERVPSLAKVDQILERIPIVRRLAREVIWLTAVV